MRIGFGYDVHRLIEGRRCILCGVEIPCDFGPDGHSDADAPLHALCDALLGALALGDIGHMFPPSDEKWRNADSVELLRLVYSEVTCRGYRLTNADITIVLEKPRVAPYIEAMRRRVADTLGVDMGDISVKATTEERLGFTGDGTGIKATAAVLVSHNR